MVCAWLDLAFIPRFTVACLRALNKLYERAIFPIHDSALGLLHRFNKPPIFIQSPDLFDVDLLPIRRGCCKGILTKIAAQILTVFAVKEHVVVLALAIGEEQVRMCRGLLGAQVFQGATEFQSVKDVRQEEGGEKTPSKMKTKSSRW